MRDGSERISRSIPGSVCDAACTDGVREGPSDVTSNVHTALSFVREKNGRLSCSDIKTMRHERLCALPLTEYG
jgi:hypothetical protein